MRRNPNWRENLQVGDTVVSGDDGDDMPCLIVEINGDIITLKSGEDIFTAQRSELK